nr:hypothetical protein [Streptomyces sp. C1-2]
MRGRLAPDTGWCTILPAVEQRIGSSKQPLEGAGLDPAYVPGLTVPGSREPEETAEAGTPAAPSPEAATEPAEAAPEPADAAPEPEAAAESAAEAAPEPADAADDTEAEVAAEGPVFEAADRRASILADAAGVRLHLDDQDCEFRWDEIAAVETAFPRFGKRFTVTVHTPQARWYYVEVEAPSRSRFAEWDKQLDEVLDAYFEEGAEGADGAEAAEDA